MNFKAAYRALLIAGLLFSSYALLALLSLPALLLRRDRFEELKLGIVHRSFALISRIAGLKVYSEGLERLPEGPYILLANHVSYWDIIALISRLPLSFLAKEEVKSWFLLGSFARMCGVIFVQRDCARSRTQALFELATRSRRQPYCIFPEGTTTDADLPAWENWFRGHISLAARPGLRIFTLGLYYRQQKEQAWIGDASFFPHLIKALRRKKIEVFLSVSELHFAAHECERGELFELGRRAFLQVRTQCQLARARAVALASWETGEEKRDWRGEWRMERRGSLEG